MTNDLLRHFWSTRRVLGHSGHLRHLGTRMALRHLGTQGTWALGHLKHSDIRRTLGHSRHLGTWAIRHLGTRGTWGTLFRRLRQILELAGTFPFIFFQGSAHRELTLNICQSFVGMSMEWNKRFHQRYYIELSLVSLLSNRPIYNVFQLYLSSWYLANGWLAWARSGIPWAVIKSSK